MAKNKFYNQTLTDESIKEFIDFPIEVNSKGKIRTVRKMIEAMKLFLHNFFRTPYQSRVMESTLGTKLYHYLGYPLTDDLRKVIEDRVKQEIEVNFSIFDIINIEVSEMENFNNGFKIYLQLDYKNIFKDEYFEEIRKDLPHILDLTVEIV